MTETHFTNGRKVVDKTVTLKAPAKVNLHLEVLRQRHDGYHEIETVFQAISLFDSLQVTLREIYETGDPLVEMVVKGDFDVPADERNLCWQAVELFCRETGLAGHVIVQLTKEIPVAAGLGGGSSDAAAVLVACNHLFRTGLREPELLELAQVLGADVPFFISGGTALGRGIGNRLTALPVAKMCQLVIVKPPIELMTSQVYSKLKMGLTVNSAKANIQVLRSLLARFPQETWPGFNRLEEVVLPSDPALQRLVMRLKELAPVAMLSGSGSGAFAAFPDNADLTDVLGEFTEAGLYCKVVGPHPVGVEIMED